MKIYKLLSSCFLIISSLIVFPNFTVAEPLDNWHLRYDSYDFFNAITYANGIFVAVGYNGAILTSPDGVTWTPRISGTTDSLYGVTYGNGTFVAVGDSGTILQSDSLSIIPVSIPTLNEWGIVIMSVLLGGSGIYLLRRRRAV